MQQDLLTQGFELLLYGMGTVVIFLCLLVLATAAMSKTIERFFPEATVPAAKPPAPRAAPAADDAELVAVITAAIRQHRQRG
ncbi:oxaloacetate decarboxylase [Mangrovimicrobium sediminis]|uniref:Probable oxaloacetate decarboxylase gamma chain n=1 Tax=Mangrovimicrobium sediminis TaxID=2562682 RepID=A0A4Z0M181_9GAMM|nr:OadG family transporter subunit [Haliea sp. SAOS-164]TGD73443.1 oxaloacetate decarboxylase [Haliea sp. SAOS-164]